jgi:flagellar motility protein MotE (MotC chaperone)
MAAKAKTAEEPTEMEPALPYGEAFDLPAPGEAETREAKKKSAPESRTARKGKKPRRGLAVIIAIVSAALVIAFAALVLAADIFGLRGGLIRAVGGLDPEFVSVETRRAELDEREASLNTREARLETEQARIASEREELENREQELYSAEEAMVPLYRQPMSSQDLEDMKALAAVYQAMDPESAAEILSMLYTTDRSAAILYYMSGKAAAAVLSAMDPGLAAEITETLLSK